MKKLLLIISAIASILLSCVTEKSIDALPPIKKRVYFIAAEEVEWNYAPTGKNEMTDPALPFGEIENIYLENTPERIGSKNIKAIYVQYTDATFTKRIPQESADMGIVGPIIRAEVGDSIEVVFKNKASFQFSIHPHGVVYDAKSEGIIGVPPGSTFTYSWFAGENAAPGKNDGSSIGWIYHSHVMDNDNQDIYVGLVGAIIVYKKGSLVNNKASDMDKEKFAFFIIENENKSLYLEKNKAKYLQTFVSNEDPDFEESNLKHCVNGLLYGACKFTNIKKGDKVRWYVFDLGNEQDNHTAHWHGNTVTFLNAKTDVVFLGPANLYTCDMNASNPGVWQFHCHVDDHIHAGMIALYEVK